MARKTTERQTERQKKRRHLPDQSLLDAVVVSHKAVDAQRLRMDEAERALMRTCLAAAKVGWSMREIAAAIDSNASTVWRRITLAENLEK